MGNMHEFMKNEAKEGKLLTDFKKVQERTCQATGISKRSIIRITNEYIKSVRRLK